MENNQIITLGGGCFWCMEAIYQRIRGVISIESGYSGGITENPTMDEVYAGDTKHAEVVQITFDSKVITLKDILEIFFTMHNPTTLNRQGNDVGDEYRSVIFYRDDEQKAVAEDMITNFAPTLWDDPIVTELVQFDKFWSAGVAQQDYFNSHPEAAYCQLVINPKLQKLRQKYAERLVKD
jgi:peptide-methionine (S)-S-oxide reductase